MVPRQVLFASRPAVGKVRVYGQLHVRVWIAIPGPRTFAFAETRDNADANPSVSRRLHKCSADRCHYPSPAAGEEVHAESGEKFSDFSTKSVVFIGTRAHHPHSLVCNDWIHSGSQATYFVAPRSRTSPQFGNALRPGGNVSCTSPVPSAFIKKSWS